MELSPALTPSEDLMAQQEELEEQMTQLGIDRFRLQIATARAKGLEDKTVYGLSLMDAMLTKVQDGIEEFMVDREAGKAGRKGHIYKYLKLFRGNLEVVAFIALKIALSSITRPNITLTGLGATIGRAVEDEHRFRGVREEDRKLYEELRKEAKTKSAYHVKRKIANLRLSRAGVEIPEAWPEEQAILLGSFLVEVVIKTTGLLERKLHNPRDKRDRKTFVVATEQARAFIESRLSSYEAMRPVYEPMVTPPIEWLGPYGGGYLTRRVRPLHLVKVFGKGGKQYLREIAEQDLSLVLEAVNAAQAVAWSINPSILSVLTLAWGVDATLGGIPSMKLKELPPKPFDIDTNEAAKTAWKRDAYTTHKDNLEMSSARASFLTTLNTAHRYSKFSAIYFPCQLDYRGRIYMVTALTPQGTDWMKGLLRFAEGKPLDEESAMFLAIHLANTGAFDKIDKAPLEDRAAWVIQNQEHILACADNPFDNRWWTEADKPYCFLAACQEWAGWVREGVGFMSHLPIALDGSCSGIQHYSMLTADEVGGAAVNLIPSDTPADIYNLVLEAVTERVQRDASQEGPHQEVAQGWLRSGLLTRPAMKRPTMTYGYGSKHFGFTQQVMDDTLTPVYKEHLRGQAPWFFEGHGFAAAVYLSGVLLTAVESTVVKAAEAMRWLADAARVVASTGANVQWTAPDGFLVRQTYKIGEEHRIDTMLLGSRIRILVKKETKESDPRKHVSGFPPNFVHSLDANHLRATVRAAAKEGITDIALIHDSFGTHAANTGRFFQLLRETMAEMYEDGGILERLHAELMTGLPEGAIKSPPERGSLDTSQVVDCDFAFA